MRLATYLGEWEILRKEHGGRLPDVFLYTMRLAMLPSDIAKELRDRRQPLDTTQRALDCFHGELARYIDSCLSRLHATQNRAHRSPGPAKPAHALFETPFRDVSDRRESCAAAFSTGACNGTKGAGQVAGSNLPEQGPNCSGCWRCGKPRPGGRRQCRLFKDLLRRNGGQFVKLVKEHLEDTFLRQDADRLPTTMFSKSSWMTSLVSTRSFILPHQPPHLHLLQLQLPLLSCPPLSMQRPMLSSSSGSWRQSRLRP